MVMIENGPSSHLNDSGWDIETNDFLSSGAIDQLPLNLDVGLSKRQQKTDYFWNHAKLKY